jgi:D-alanyl-D-alanine carboxypeptidase/D-alanyl-D-alanine-endopeptidase (penicillin-binding protein 4)
MLLQRLSSGLMALMLELVGIQPAHLNTVQLLAWQDAALFSLPSEPDPAAASVIKQSLKGWSTKGLATSNQGVWMQSGMTRLANNQGTVPLPAASLTKIATTLAALQHWGPNHQFETLVSATGPIKNGVLQGDLVITGSGDPFFVWEEAIALGNTLNKQGIRRVTGRLIVTGDFYMNYQENQLLSAQMLASGMNSALWSRAVTLHYSRMRKGTPKPQVAIAGGVAIASYPIPKKYELIRHHSLPLTQILKELNIYSNNAMSEMLATSLGGAKVVAKLAAETADVPQQEIQLINGSGLGMENRISPRAACAMLMAIERSLKPHQLTVADLFPVSGRDNRGTLLTRNIPQGTVIKTGTLREVSALAGVMPTRDRGLVWFAIINRGGDIASFKAQQDQILTQLSKQWGTASLPKVTTTNIQASLGDTRRNEIISEVRIPLEDLKIRESKSNS